MTEPSTEPPQEPSTDPPVRSDPERSAGGVGAPLPYAFTAERADDAAEQRPRAVFIAHGMGQQAPFATLDQLAAGLRREDARRRGKPVKDLALPVAREVVIPGDGGRHEERLGRLEVKLARDGAGEQEVHLYEGYWSYLTAGKVTLRNVIGFLFRAGRNGLGNGLRTFPRWLFGEVREFPAQIRTVVYLLFALALVASLVEINTIIVAVAAARAPFERAPDWLSPGLFADLTTTFNLLLAVYATVGLAMLLSVLLRRVAAGRRGLRRLVLRVSAVLFYLALVATPIAGVLTPILLYLHGQRVTDAERQAGREFWPELAGDWVGRFNNGWERCLLGLAALAAAYFLVVWFVRFVTALAQALRTTSAPSDEPGPEVPRPKRAWTLTTVALLILGGAAVFAVACYFGRASGEPGGVGAAVSGLSWPLLIALSAGIRSLLVQYVGDVAVYVDAHVLDSFHEVRERICSRVQRKAHAVYAARVEDRSGPAYRDVFVVGHSLGSVLVYDVLNRLITDDELAQTRSGRTSLDVAGRTRLLVTFGSPLDKVAFLFGLRAGHDGEVARELINAWRQPLIREARFRPFRWLNVYAPADVFSGHLDYFDPPPGSRGEEPELPDPVDNAVDEDALTLLAAHSEYWGGSAVFAPLYEELTR